jgi:hypothetical protein
MDFMGFFQDTALLAKLPLGTMIALGCVATLVLMLFSYNYWRTAVKIAFILVLFEGAIRKWGFPQAQELIYFGKDMILMGAYLRFYFSSDPELKSYRLEMPMMMIFVTLLLVGLTALNPNIGSPILAAVGLKGYFMYIPMCFMMPYLFRTQKEMISQLTYYALLATPICILGFLQWKSDRFSMLNTFAAGMGDEGATGFGFGDKARITGTFSYLTGHSTFVTFFIGLHVALLTCVQPAWRKVWLMVNLPLLLANGFMGGSRSAILSSGIVAGGFLLIAFVYKIGSNAKAIRYLLLGGAASFVGVVFFFQDTMQTWFYRATNSDTFKQRVVDSSLTSFKLLTIDEIAMGYGMGTTMPAVIQVRNILRIAPPKDRPPLMDYEMMQVVIELGFICTFIWYGFRLYILGSTFTWFRNCPASDVRSIVLLGVLVQIPYLYLSAVLNHTANFLLWGAIGLSFIPAMKRVNPLSARR